MEFPAISPSKTLPFPANFSPKPKLLHFQKLLRKISGHSKPNLAGNSVQASMSSFTISKKLKDEKERESENSSNEEIWIHFVGIGDCGLSALAMLAIKQGYEVSGSDMRWSSYMNPLQDAGACLHIGHSETNVQRSSGSAPLKLPDAVVVSSAIPQDNVEILYAKSVGVPVYKQDRWLRLLTQGYNLIAVSGSHGKSTTASMLAYVLDAMGDNPTAVVGVHVPQFSGGNIILGTGQNFVLEADEYDSCFLELSPYVAVVTNLEWEHVDIFPNEEAVKATFRKFLNQIGVGGHLILCGDSAGAYSLLTDGNQATGLDNLSGRMAFEKYRVGYNVTTYGTESSNEWHASSIRPNVKGGSDYTLCHCSRSVAEISLQIPGLHNVLNSLAMIGRIYGCHIYDDYAHHPTEVRAVIQAAHERFPTKSLLMVFQPHSYSHLAALKDDFASALCGADQVVVTEVYVAREVDVGNVGGRELAASIIGPHSEYIPYLDVVEKLMDQICKNPHRNIVVLTLGAGGVIEDLNYSGDVIKGGVIEDLNYSGVVTTVGPKLLYQLQRTLQVT